MTALMRKRKTTTILIAPTNRRLRGVRMQKKNLIRGAISVRLLHQRQQRTSNNYHPHAPLPAALVGRDHSPSTRRRCSSRISSAMLVRDSRTSGFLRRGLAALILHLAAVETHAPNGRLPHPSVKHNESTRRAGGPDFVSGPSNVSPTSRGHTLTRLIARLAPTEL